MSQYLVQFLLKSKISQDEAEQFIEEVLTDVRGEHLFPSEAVQLVKVSKKTKLEKIAKSSYGVVPEEEDPNKPLEK